ncbi:MAG TPA: hypothetical protein VKK79_12895, partial [Candidatus Lokiarchaeia archaeon]|nr:hypothetical protein [Candidatus Lokiarchaeia archaeon]
MVQATPDSILGNRLRRLFVVFLVSHFVVFIQVWLTMEYLRISQELKKLNEGRGDGRLESSAKFFLIASILTICSLLIFIVILFIMIISFFGGIFQVNLEIFFVNSLSLLLIALIIPMVLDALQMCSLYLAWVPLDNYFGSYQGFDTRFGGVRSTNRILTGIIRSFVAEILEIIGYTLLVCEINTLLAVPTNSSFEMSLQFIFIGFVLLIIGGVIGTIGFANQSIGLYN